jgi:hypothetical protein
VFRKGDVLTPYIGELLSQEELDDRYEEDEVAPYVDTVEVGMNGDDMYVDGACMRGVASLANDAIPGSMCTGKCKTNARFWSGDGNYPILEAIRSIRDGDEIFVEYGLKYWTGEQRAHFTIPVARYGQIEYKC